MAKTANERLLHQQRIQDRRDRLVSEIRIWDLLNKLGIEERASRKGKIHCIFPHHTEKTPSMKVYPETDSVYCFGCNSSADVVEVARRCAGDRAWSLERALDWLEEQFEIEPQTKLVTFSERLKSRLKNWREEKKPVGIDPVRLKKQLEAEMEELKQDLPGWTTVSLFSVEDYIWDQLERPGTDPIIWYSWAKKLVAGYYNRSISDIASMIESPEWQAGLFEAEFQADLLADDHLAADKVR